MEQIGRLFVNLQQSRRVPQMLSEIWPSMVKTLSDKEMPSFFRERYIHAGYRALNQSWKYYALSLLQRHNETVNVWTHLIGAVVVLVITTGLSETVDFKNDPHSWPLLILLLSSMAYLGFSAIAHLLASKSVFWHYTFYYLDYIGVALYQYGSAVAHFYYAIEESWHNHVQVCLPGLVKLAK
ncbi:hypothetical protein DNTS_026801 [Danionella cerebrum]|uniref:Uncharacterized protein n=1 Tax=Danionella cerebrum TaxID=2873325 RepID=A0A553R1B9_9TELE|nr:hypothetical protein DNTS_026801 [Danionella translucida]